MANYKVISKGEFPCPENAPVYALEYVIAKDNGLHFLLLKFFNNKEYVLEQLRFRLKLLDEKGEVLSEKTYSSVSNAANGSFVFKKSIAVPANCVLAQVEILTARYGDFRYVFDGNDFSVEYLKKESEQKSKKLSRKKRKFKPSFVFAAFSLVALILISVISLYQYFLFVYTEDSISNLFVEYSINGDELEVTGYNGSSSNIVIPAQIDGYNVTGVSSAAFFGDTEIISITFEGNVTIGDRAFYGCSNLQSVSFENVTSVGSSAFYGCSGLAEISSDCLESIGSKAFYLCTSLTSVAIGGNGALTLGDSVWTGCSALESVSIEKNIIYPSGGVLFSGCSAIETLTLYNLYEGDGATIATLFGVSCSSVLSSVAFTTLTTIPDNFCYNLTSLTSFSVGFVSSGQVGEYAFFGCSNLTSCSLPKGITSVGDYAFYKCAITSFDFDSLEEMGQYCFSNSKLAAVDLSLNETLESISQFAFYNCTSLRRVTLSETVQTISSNAFQKCTALSLLTLQSGLCEIGEYAFQGCSSLVDVTFPDTCTVYGDRCFDSCKALLTLTFPAGATYFGAGLLTKCSALTSLSLPFVGENETSNNFLAYLFGGSSYEKSSSIPSTLTKLTITAANSIGEGAFYDCSVTDFTFSSSLTTVGDYAFAYCDRVTRLSFASTSLASIGDYAFIGCSSLTSVSLSTSLREIGAGAFSYSGLKTINLSSTSVTEIANETFEGCDSLQYIDLTKASVTTIGDYAFAYCTSLTSAAFSSSLTSVGKYAFYGCNALAQVSIYSVLGVGQGAFLDCENLTTIYNYGGMELFYGSSDFGYLAHYATSIVEGTN